MFWVLELVQLDFIDFDDSLMKAYDNYYILFFTPKFNISILSDKLLDKIKLFLELYLGKDNFTLNIIDKHLRRNRYSENPFAGFDFNRWPTSSANSYY